MKSSATGYRLAFAAAAISGVSIYLNTFAVRAVPDAALYTTLKNALAGLVLLAPIVVVAGRRRELARLGRRELAWLLVLAVAGGSVPYVLFFTGLQMTTATTGSLLNHSQFIVVALLAVPLLRERVTGFASLGLVVLALGTAAGTDVHALRLNEGALLVLASTVLFGASAVLARHLLSRLSPELVMAAKMSAGAALLLAYSATTGHLAAAASLSASQWAIAAGSGLILVAFTVATVYALRHAPALSVTAIGMASVPITLALQLAAAPASHVTPGTLGSVVLVSCGASMFLLAGHRQQAAQEATAA